MQKKIVRCFFIIIATWKQEWMNWINKNERRTKKKNQWEMKRWARNERNQRFWANVNIWTQRKTRGIISKCLKKYIKNYIYINNLRLFSSEQNLLWSIFSIVHYYTIYSFRKADLHTYYFSHILENFNLVINLYS